MHQSRGAAAKTALRWKIPAAQRQRIRMVLLPESGRPARNYGDDGRVAEHGEPRTHGLCHGGIEALKPRLMAVANTRI